jgi:drug/metabolite transporter (DMT)-like permease
VSTRSLGIVLGLLAALCSSLVAFFLKKLNNLNIHYSVIIIYASYFGIPLSLALSVVRYAIMSDERLNDELKKSNATTTFDSQGVMAIFTKTSLISWQIVYVLVGALSGILAQIMLNWSLKYEETFKISIILTTDIVFVFLLQYFLLDIKVDFYETLGAGLIVLGTLIIIGFKFFETNKFLLK